MEQPLSEFGRRLGRLATHAGARNETAIAKAALVVKEAVVAQMHGVTRLRGVGRRGARIGVRYTITGTGGEAMARIKATGPFHLLERPTRAHDILPATRQALKIGDQFAAYAHSSGTRGKYPWRTGTEIGKPAALKRYEAELRKEIRETLTGK